MFTTTLSFVYFVRPFSLAQPLRNIPELKHHSNCVRILFLIFCYFSIVLVLIFVVFSRRQESHMKYAGPDDDVRENIINYDDEGGGEDDMTAYDITPLQIPIPGGPLAGEHHGNRKLGSCKLLV